MGESKIGRWNVERTQGTRVDRPRPEGLIGVRVGILAVGEISPNQEAFLVNLARLIGQEAQLDLVSDRPLPSSLGSGYRQFVYHLRAASRGLRRLESIGALLQYARSERPDVLTHVIDFETYGLVVTLVGRMKGIPSVVRYAGQVLESYRVQPRLRLRIKTFLLCNVLGQVPLHWSDRIIALGPTLARELQQHGARSDKVVVLPQPVDRSSFEPADDQPRLRVALGLPADKKVILYVGRLSWLKGADVFLRVVPAVVERRKDLFFCFIGSGPYEEQLRLLAAPSVVVGAVPHERVPDYYKAADLLVHPSRTDGVPTAVLEAVASGLPVVSRDVGDVGTLTKNVFHTEDELVAYLLHPEWPADTLPDIFEDAELRRRYLSLLGDVAGIAG
jgi:glycosyltransferase involved in cell wall biosynthesis